MKNICKCRIGTKILIVILGLSLISLSLFGYIGLTEQNELGEYSLKSSTSFGEDATNDSIKALENLGEQLIEQKAKDIAKQMEIYISLNKNFTIFDLQADSKFQNISVQDVGKTGYTVALDINNGTYYFHKFPETFVNKNYKDLFNNHDSDFYNPHVYDLIDKVITSRDGFGDYYEWIEPDSGELKNKYVAFAVVNVTTVDNVRMFVAATTYIDEFSKPAEEIKIKISNETRINNKHIDEKLEKTQKIFISILIPMIIIVSLLAIVLSKKITNPILELKRGAQSIGKGDLDYIVKVATGDELEDLSNSFNKMAFDLKIQIKKVEDTTRDKERIERELQIANEIQKSFLPLKSPEIEGYTLTGKNIPAREVGGDFYDFIELGDNKIGIVIADVSGKGVPAALFMAISKTLLHVNAKKILDPIEALNEVNSILVEESESGMFVTIFYAILDSKNHTLTFINAGHNPPLLLKESEKDIILLKAKGIAIGVTEEANLESKEIKIEKNDILFLYTDGVTEAVNVNDEEFGNVRLKEIIIKEKDNSPDDLIEKILKEIKQFEGKREQFDDITMVVLQSKGDK